MEVLYLLGKRLSNGAKINTRNYLDLSTYGLATKKDHILLEKFRESNLRKSLKDRSKKRDRYS